ncbi:MAG: anhydro-N-acetylmuramic acid kinase [Phycisphaerae bacterium]|nr:anhydro-N-acetylmuramic acid kinase [Phycisphaerae bacterium]
MTRLVVGCMTGTSLDGLDVALVRIEGRGLDMTPSLLRAASHPLGELATRLRTLAEDRPVPASAAARAALELALLHAEAVTSLLGSDRADLICVHGQTIHHAPPVSWQLIQPAPIARAAGAPVVYDLRQADLAAGGQGAPITPLADWILFRSPHRPVAVVNLGGFCNVTLLPRDAGGEPSASLRAIRAGDVCACNHVLDAVARRMLDRPFDAEGAIATYGRVDPAATDDLLRFAPDPTQSAHRTRSLGSGDEAIAWVERHAQRLSAADLSASACRAVAMAVARWIDEPHDVLLAGGGRRNQRLRHELAAALGDTPRSDHELAEYREAACFAVLGALAQDRVPLTLPHVTGLPAGQAAPVAGAWVLP